MKEADVFVARPGDAADADLIDHVDVAFRFAAGAADVERRRHAALENMDQRIALADVDVFQMRRVRSFPRRPAMGEIVGSKKIGLGRVVENIIAGVDAGVEMRVDKTRRNQAAFGVDFLVDRLGVFLADELDAVTVENHDAVFDDFMFLAVEADDPAALDQCFHRWAFQSEIRTEAGLTKEEFKTSTARRSSMRWRSITARQRTTRRPRVLSRIRFSLGD